MDNFNHIKHEPLKIYNRAVMACNIKEDSGIAAFEEYVAQFSPKELKDMYNLLALVKKLGLDYVRKLVTHNMELQEDE